MTFDQKEFSRPRVSYPNVSAIPAPLVPFPMVAATGIVTSKYTGGYAITVRSLGQTMQGIIGVIGEKPSGGDVLTAWAWRDAHLGCRCCFADGSQSAQAITLIDF